MGLSHQEIDRRMAAFMEVCRREGVKVTHQRMEIFREVASTEEHPDVETIHRRVRRRFPTVSLDTVYRALSLLERLGLLSRVHFLSDRARFDANTRPHHHYVCSRCGTIKDFYSQEAYELQIPDDIRSWGTIDTMRVELEGICSKCAETNNRQKFRQPKEETS